MSCCDDEKPRMSSKMLCPCKKCKEERGERQSFQIAARAANNANNFARAGGNCLGKLTAMIPWPCCDQGQQQQQQSLESDSCDTPKPKCCCDAAANRSKGGENGRSKKNCGCCCPPPKEESVDCCCDDESAKSFDCDEDKAACLCAATPDAASSISCFICECVATIGFFVIAIVVFWVSAGYHLGQMFWRFYKTQPKVSKRLQSQANNNCPCGDNAAKLDCTKI